jgi:branched-chain amino acid transport system ATP-binding protein
MTAAPILLEAQGVEKRYDKFVALGGVDLKVRANTVRARPRCSTCSRAPSR